jgi:hypothetical protein
MLMAYVHKITTSKKAITNHLVMVHDS